MILDNLPINPSEKWLNTGKATNLWQDVLQGQCCIKAKIDLLIFCLMQSGKHPGYTCCSWPELLEIILISLMANIYLSASRSQLNFISEQKLGDTASVGHWDFQLWVSNNVMHAIHVDIHLFSDNPDMNCFLKKKKLKYFTSETSSD